MTDPVLHTRWPLAEAVRDAISIWTAEYLAAYERATDTPTGRHPEFRSKVIRHAAYFRAQEQTPALVVALGGARPASYDPDGTIVGVVDFDVFIAVAASDLAATSELLATYVAVVEQILFDHGDLGGYATTVVLADEDLTGVDAERDEVLQVATLSFEAHGVVLGRYADGPPAIGAPREDPSPEWPARPTVETTHQQIYPFDPED